jgi:site-specific recombinase XerC
MKIPTRTELIKIFGVIDPRSAFGKRDQAIIIFAANTGLRVSELCGLNVYTVLTSEGVRPSFSVPRAWAKGKHSREIPINASAAKAVLQLLRFNQARGFSIEPTAPLIQDRFHRRMPARSVQRMLQTYREKAEVSDQVTPHKLRHYCADWALRRCGNHRAVQNLLGHRRLASVEVYTRATPEDVRKAVGAN